jgi:hypothetical protein
MQPSTSRQQIKPGRKTATSTTTILLTVLHLYFVSLTLSKADGLIVMETTFRRCNSTLLQEAGGEGGGGRYSCQRPSVNFCFYSFQSTSRHKHTANVPDLFTGDLPLVCLCRRRTTARPILLSISLFIFIFILCLD